MRAALYRRVSTLEQSEKWSLDAQRTELLAMVARRGWEVVRDFSDCESGAEPERPGLRALLDAAARGEFDVVAVVDMDRLTRLGDLAWAELKASLRESGVQVVTLSGQTLDFTDEDSELLGDIFAAFGRFERRKIITRTRRGLAEAARQGRWSGSAPYGYRVENGRLVPDPEEAAIVESIFKWYGQEGLGSGAIASRLAGVPSPRGGAWTSTLVLRILANETYKGCRRVQVSGQEIVSSCPALVPEGLWERCREILDRRANEHRAHLLASADSLLTGLVWCADCGRPLHAKTDRVPGRNGQVYAYRYYRHRDAERKGSATGESCRASHRADVLEARLIDLLRRLASDPEAIREMVLLQDLQGRVEELEEQVAAERAVLARLEAKVRKVLDLYLEGDLDREEYRQRRAALDAEVRLRRRRLEEVEEELRGLRAQQVDPATVQEYLGLLARHGLGLPPRERKEFVRLLITRLDVTMGNEVTVYCRLPVEAGELVPLNTIRTRT